jgi:HD-GYP domain-containing protein (c-di-GMP phosphodiesterase class II)
MSTERDAGTVLVVVDDDEIRAGLVSGLEVGAYRPVAVGGPDMALARLRHAQVHPAVAVVRLDGDASAAFLRRARQLDPQLGAVLVSSVVPGEGECPDGLLGVTWLAEPFEVPDLLQAVAWQLRRRIERAAEAEWRRVLGQVVEERCTLLERKLEQFAVASLEVLVTALEARDPFFSGHSQRVAQLSASLAHTLGHPDGEIESVRLAGRLHDIGMLSVSDRVVNHDGPLSPADREQMQQHPVIGHQILLPYAHLADVCRFVRGHHERWDGTGYPDGLAGGAIPWGGRIVAVVEVYDAMVTSRAHRRQALSQTDACRELQRLAGTAFDPAVVNALTAIVGGHRALEFLLDQQPRSGLSDLGAQAPAA